MVYYRSTKFHLPSSLHLGDTEGGHFGLQRYKNYVGLLRVRVRQKKEDSKKFSLRTDAEKEEKRPKEICLKDWR